MKTDDSFAQRFGDIRSILNTTPFTQDEADKLWEHMFACSTADRPRFFKEIEPHVRQTGFFERPFTVPMFQSMSALKQAYEPHGGYAVWGTEYYSDDFSLQLIYGVMIDGRRVALQGAELDNEVELWVPDPEEYEEFQGKVLLGIEPTDILAQDTSKQSKVEQCNARFEARMSAHYPNLDLSGYAPTLYLILQGRSVECTLSMGPLKEIKGSAGNWDVKSKYDILREHDCYDQDTQVEGPAYACACVETFYGAGVHEIDIRALNETNPKKVFKSPDGKILRGYTFTTHM